MSEISDEMLMAYADGELRGSQRDAVEEYLQTSPDAQHRLEVYAATGRSLADLFAQPMLEPVPKRLIDAVAVRRKIIDFSALRALRRGATTHVTTVAVAACAVIVAMGAGTVWMLKSAPTVDDATFAAIALPSGVLVADASLAEVLTTAESGSRIARTIAGVAATVTPIFTFAAADKSYCRQYVVSRDKNNAFGGVACREHNGIWRIEAHVAFTPAPAKDKQMAPAGNVTLKAVEATVDRLIDGDVLSSDDEANVIAKGWSAPAP